MNVSRRRFTAMAAMAPLFGLSACNSDVTFKMVQGYVTTLQGFVDKLAPLLEQVDAADSDKIKTIVTNVDTAAQKLEGLPSPGADGSGLAQTVVQSTLAAIQIAEMFPLPAMPKSVLESMSLLIVVIGGFFNMKPSAAAGPLPHSVIAAGSKYRAAADKASARREAQSTVDAWISTR